MKKIMSIIGICILFLPIMFGIYTMSSAVGMNNTYIFLVSMIIYTAGIIGLIFIIYYHLEEKINNKNS